MGSQSIKHTSPARKLAIPKNRTVSLKFREVMIMPASLKQNSKTIYLYETVDGVVGNAIGNEGENEVEKPHG